MPVINDTIALGTVIVGLLGGLALFLFGMEQMTDALKTLAGNRMKNLLSKLTGNRVTGAATGALVTAIIQSSSVTTVLVVGFITAGLMTLAQSIAVIMGANIGTTITAQIIAFKVTQYGLILVAIGFALLFTAKRQRYKQLGTMIMGLGLIFFGMDLMSNATKPLRTYQPYIDLLQQIDTVLVAILISALFTAIIQSSSATTGVIIVLASQGLISLETGIALAFGANIGTCVTALLASIGKPRPAVQAAFVHVIFNVAGVLIWVPFIEPLAEIVRTLSPSYGALTGMERLAAETPRQIANAHTFFNLINTAIFLPFTNLFARLVQWLIPEKPTPMPQVLEPIYLDNTVLDTPDLALDRVRRELARLGTYATQMLRKALPSVLHGSAEDLEDLSRMDDDVDHLQGAIVSYLGELSQENLLHNQTERLYDYMAVANYIENVADMVETNLVEAGHERIEANVTFSGATQEAIRALHAKVCWSVEQALTAVNQDDMALAQEVIDAKPEINRLAAAIDDHLAHRLTADEPNRMQVFRIESDIIENFRRIYYFAKRISKAIVEENMVDRRQAARELLPEFVGD